MIVTMRPRFASSTLEPPVYVDSIVRHTHHAGFIRFKLGRGEFIEIPFASQLEFRSLVQRLIDERVPLSVGGALAGAIDEALLLIKDGVLNGCPIQISWTAPETWTIRESWPESFQWDEAIKAEAIANCKFDPRTLLNLNPC